MRRSPGSELPHAAGLAGLFGLVLALCARAGVLRSGLVAIDGTKLAASASRDANLTAEQLAAEILAEADAVDVSEAATGEVAEMPALVAKRGAKRKARLRELLDELEAEAAEKSYEAHTKRQAEIEARTGRPVRGRPPSADAATHKSRRHANVADPDSRLLKTNSGYVQGYNAQAVSTEDQYVVAAEVTNQVELPGTLPHVPGQKWRPISAGGGSSPPITSAARRAAICASS